MCDVPVFLRQPLADNGVPQRYVPEAAAADEAIALLCSTENSRSANMTPCKDADCNASRIDKSRPPRGTCPDARVCTGTRDSRDRLGTLLRFEVPQLVTLRFRPLSDRATRQSLAKRLRRSAARAGNANRYLQYEPAFLKGPVDVAELLQQAAKLTVPNLPRQP
jgi:hypothetical protein